MNMKKITMNRRPRRTKKAFLAFKIRSIRFEKDSKKFRFSSGAIATASVYIAKPTKIVIIVL